MSDLAVAVVEQKPMELSVQEVKNQVQKIQSLMGDLMKEGEHYGASFVGDTKKNLLKPGADKLMFMFRLRPDFHQDIKELSGGHREVFTRCEIYHGRTVGKTYQVCRQKRGAENRRPRSGFQG
jgi:hypothetical protein